MSGRHLVATRNGSARSRVDLRKLLILICINAIYFWRHIQKNSSKFRRTRGSGGTYYFRGQYISDSQPAARRPPSLVGCDVLAPRITQPSWRSVVLTQSGDYTAAQNFPPVLQVLAPQRCARLLTRDSGIMPLKSDGYVFCNEPIVQRKQPSGYGQSSLARGSH